MEKEILQDSDPMVSIALCTYNGEKYLSEQIESILQQSYTNLEIIIVDDASSDSTIGIINQFVAKDSRIKFYLNESNLGYNKNFEKAFSLCSAEYIAISDQDDIWEKQKIRVMMAAWPNEALLIYSISGEFKGENLNKHKKKTGIRYSDLTDVRMVVFGSDVLGHATIFKKKLLQHCKPFPADIYYDWWLCMHAASISYIPCVPQILTWHRFHENNISQQIGLIKDKNEKQQLLRKQYANLIGTFFAGSTGREKERASLLKYASLLKKMDGRHFNIEMFFYVLKNRKWIFHYKKKPLVSHIKHAFRMAYTGLLRY